MASTDLACVEEVSDILEVFRGGRVSVLSWREALWGCGLVGGAIENCGLCINSGRGKDSRRPGKGNGVSGPLPARTGA